MLLPCKRLELFLQLLVTLLSCEPSSPNIIKYRFYNEVFNISPTNLIGGIYCWLPGGNLDPKGNQYGHVRIGNFRNRRPIFKDRGRNITVVWSNNLISDSIHSVKGALKLLSSFFNIDICGYIFHTIH